MSRLGVAASLVVVGGAIGWYVAFVFFVRAMHPQQ